MPKGLQGFQKGHCNYKPIQDLTGKHFGNLVVLKRVEKPKEYKQNIVYWLCRCSCGEEIVSSRSRLTRSKNPAKKCHKCWKLPSIEVNRRGLFALYKVKAKYRKHSFELSRAQFDKLISGNCNYCGKEPLQIHKQKYCNSMKYNGIDRINPKKGYTKENTVSCCKLCNFMKLDLTVKQFLKHINRIKDFCNYYKEHVEGK